ncbi:MAG: hypothetical protein Q9224_006108, partial [Gallowayella concinna]
TFPCVFQKQQRAAKTMPCPPLNGIGYLQIETSVMGILNRFSQVLSRITHSVNQGRLIWSHIAVVKLLEADVADPNVSAFTLRICSDDLVLPQTWLYLHLPLVCDSAASRKLHMPSHKREYQNCLLRLVKQFCVVLKYMDQQLWPNSNLRLGNQNYQISLLQQRNAELLAIALLNIKLSDTNHDNVAEFISTAKLVEETVNLRTVNQPDLNFKVNNFELCQQIGGWCAKYKGKNPLVVIRQYSRSNPKSFPKTTISMNMDEALALRARLPHGRNLPQQKLGNSLEFYGQSTSQTIEAVRKLQSWWRVRSSLQRCLTNSFDAGQIVRFNTLMSKCPAGALRFAWRLLFVRHGFNSMDELTKAQDRCISVRASVISAMEISDEPSVYDELDQALVALDDIESSLKVKADTVSHVELHSIIKSVKPLEMRTRFDKMKAAIQQADQQFKNVGAVVKEAHKHCTV